MRFITLDKNKKIISIRHGEKMVEGEIQSDVGELGQIMQEDGTFIMPAPESASTEPTLEDKINYIYYKEKGIIV